MQKRGILLNYGKKRIIYLACVSFTFHKKINNTINHMQKSRVIVQMPKNIENSTS